MEPAAFVYLEAGDIWRLLYSRILQIIRITYSLLVVREVGKSSLLTQFFRQFVGFVDQFVELMPAGVTRAEFRLY